MPHPGPADFVVICENLRPFRRVSQMRAPMAVCCEPAGRYNRLSYVLYVFEDKTQHLLIHAPYTRFVVF